MIPVGAIAGLAMLAARLLARESAGARVRQGGAASARVLQSGIGWRRVLGFTLGFAILTAAVLFAVLGWPWLLLATPVGLTLALPEFVALSILAPLGWVYGAWAVDRVFGASVTTPDRRHHPGLVGAYAALRRPRASDADFIERDLARGLELGTTGAAAAALLAVGRGDLELARSLFCLLVEMGARDADGLAARVALEFFVLEAAAEGDWQRVLAATSRTHTSSRLTLLMAAIARRALGYPSRGLWIHWAVAPERRATRAILATVRGVDPEAPPAVVRPDLGAFAALLAKSRSRIRKADVAAAVESFDAMRASTALVVEVTRRALGLGLVGPAIDAAAIVERVITESEDDLVAFLLKERLPAAWVPPGPSGERVRMQLGEARLLTVESLAGEVERRTRQRIDLPEVEEWRAWGDLRAACEQVRGDAAEVSARRVLFEMVYQPATSYGVRLANVRSCRVLAREIFRFLGQLASEADAEEAQQLMAKNVGACSADRLPRQDVLAGELLYDSAMFGLVRRWIRWLFLTTLILLVPAGAMVLWGPPAIMAIGQLVFPAGVLILLAVRRIHARILQAAWTADGLVLQNHLGRFYAAPADVCWVRSGPGGILRLRLRRAPRWLPAAGIVIVGSRAEARAKADRLRTLLWGSEAGEAASR